MATPSKEVATIGTRFPALAGQDSEALDIVRANIGDGELNVLDLDAIGIPPGGGTSWEIPSLEGSTSVKELEGVIVAWRSPRTYYMLSIDESGGGQPPDCSSDDGVFGNGLFGPGSEGNPTGKCESCPMNVWGSADGDSKGKACREARQLFMLTEGSVLPLSVSLPPTSIRPLKQYMLRLASSGTFYYGVTTKLALEPQSSGGRKWSVAIPSLGERLEPAQVEAAKAVGESLRAAMSRPAPATPAE